MFLRIFLFSSAFVVASANSAIPVQTYLYQQNGYMNPTPNQQYNIQPYNQGAMAQNQLQQFNISPSSIKQALLNKLLTNPSVQTVSDPYTRNYGSNLSGVQNNYIPANYVNNYAVAPKESLNNASAANIQRESNEGRNAERPRQRNKKRKTKRKRKQNGEEKIEDNITRNLSSKLDESTTNSENITAGNKSSRKNTRKEKTQGDDPKKNVEDTETENKTKRNRRRKKKQKEQAIEIPPVEEEKKIENTIPQKRRKTQKVHENNATESEVDVKSKEIKENLDLDITSDAKDNENRRTRNSKQETNDLVKAIPSAPKEMSNPFFTNFNQFNNPMMSNWFSNYKNLFKPPQPNKPTVSESKPKKRRKLKRHRKHKRKRAQNKNIAEHAPTLIPTSTVDTTTTTESIIHVEDITEANLNSEPTTESLELFDMTDKDARLSSNEIFKDGYTINEFEDRFDEGYYGGYIDDYYPLFSDSAAYNANNKEVILKNLNDNKYYYATDRIETDVTKKRRKPNRDLTERVPIYYRINKHTYDEVEKESIRNAYKSEFDDLFEEQIQFRSPPLLESPDFRTRKIDKSILRPEVYYTFDDNDKYVGDKSSSYSMAKTPYYSGVKHNEIKIQPKEVETVNAKSEVVSYGPVYIPEPDSTSAASNDSSWTDHSFSMAKTPYYSGVKHNEIKIQPKEVETVNAKSEVVSYGPVYIPEPDSTSAASNDSSWTDHSFSMAKTPYYSGVKHNEIKIQPKEVETVNAKSKVVSYGPVYIPEPDSTSAASNDSSWTDHSFTNKIYQSGGITYVVATSVEHPDLYW